MDISLVIPLFNEEDSLSPLTDWIFESLKDEEYKFEIIFVDFSNCVLIVQLVEAHGPP